MPPGWLIDKNGAPTTDPSVMMMPKRTGALLPLGGTAPPSLPEGCLAEHDTVQHAIAWINVMSCHARGVRRAQGLGSGALLRAARVGPRSQPRESGPQKQLCAPEIFSTRIHHTT